MSDQDPSLKPNCCGGSDPNKAAGCCCGDAPPRKFHLRTLIFLAVMLAAIGVGAYSFWAKSAVPACGVGQDCGTSGGSCCPGSGK